jgi:hypothetical protein
MKFYKDNNWHLIYKIQYNKLTAIYLSHINSISFFKNGKKHNYKNAAYISYYGIEEFYLNGKDYGTNYTFTKSSWRKFVKMQVFL